MQKVVIAGGGVNGLFAALQLFRAGMDVVLVNDRLKYTRPQIVVYMTFWMANFRYLLGTKYNEIFENINSSGSGYLNKECGIISIRYMEQALLKRLEELAQFVKEKQKNENNKSVEGCTKCVKMGHKKIEAKLELLYGYTVTGLEMFGKDKELKAILKKKGSLLPFSNKQMPVDLFLCMGGASDKLRAPLLSKFCHNYIKMTT
jgi:heterodisulfide reductase subunit A-like polyferredoxin